MTKAIDPATLKSATRQTPDIDPARVSLQNAGQIWREFMVRCPADMVSDDLKHPEIWRRLQVSGSRNALKKHDRVYVVSYDEAWVAEAIVASADGKGAVLAKPASRPCPSATTSSSRMTNIGLRGMGMATLWSARLTVM
ncbi:hypothetical protein NKH47_14715 [Mesorhizobium sp. M1060]|uniref:hypothetical protein n=1 Tax=Mesorhizobium sp. M1060 TaxID=2957052 RepID=UPI00333B0101